VEEQFTKFRRAIPKLKRADLLVDEIKRWIVTGKLQPGDRLPRESQLIELLESSRGTVREALKVLESQGLVEIVRGVEGGARVSSVSYETVSQSLSNYLYFQKLSWAQVYRVREKLEPMMAAEVVGVLTRDDFDALRRTVEVCTLGIEGKVSVRAHRIAEIEFHSILSRNCKDPILRFTCCFINDMLRDLLLPDLRDISGPIGHRFSCEAIDYHSKLINALEAKEVKKVEKLMYEHIHSAGCLIVERANEVDMGSLLSRPTESDWMTMPDSVAASAGEKPIAAKKRARSRAKAKK
jgi:DNA-binding FadR family transcriptional regulator